MIKSRKFFYSAILLLMLSMALIFPFPHEYPYGESLHAVNSITLTTDDGWYLPGVTSFVFLISGLLLLFRSLNKYQGRMVFAAVLFTAITPHLTVSLYQKTIASGINAIAYDRHLSECSFESIDSTTLHAECELPFKNHSRESVDFTIDFYEKYRSEEEMPMVSLLNHGSPYHVSMGGKEEKAVKIQAEIAKAKLKKPINGGHASQVSLMIQQGKKVRKL